MTAKDTNLPLGGRGRVCARLWRVHGKDEETAAGLKALRNSLETPFETQGKPDEQGKPFDSLRASQRKRVGHPA
jgi:hypothetical protein